MSWSITDHYDNDNLFVIFGVKLGYNVSEGEKISIEDLEKYNIKTKDLENFSHDDLILFYKTYKDNAQNQSKIKLPTNLGIKKNGKEYQLILLTPDGKKIIRKTREKVSNIKPASK